MTDWETPPGDRGYPLRRPGLAVRSPLAFGVASVAAIVALYYSVPIMVAVAVPGLRSDDGMRWLLVGAQVGVMLPLTLLFAGAQPLPRRELFRLRGVPLPTLAIALGGMLALLVLTQYLDIVQEVVLAPSGLLSWYDHARDTVQQSYQGVLGWSGAWGLLRAWLVGAAVPCICEELTFRGLVQRTFERALPPAGAIAFTAVIFAAIHLQPTNFLALAMLGGYFGFIAQRTGSLLPSVVSHMTFNTIMVLLLNVLDDTGRHADAGDLLRMLPVALAAGLLFLVAARTIARRHPAPVTL